MVCEKNYNRIIINLLVWEQMREGVTTALLCFKSGLTLSAILWKANNCPPTICSHYLLSLYAVSSSSHILLASHIKIQSHYRALHESVLELIFEHKT